MCSTTMVHSGTQSSQFQHSRFEEHVSGSLTELDLDFEDGVVRFVLVLVVALQEVLALGFAGTGVLRQIDLHKAKLCARE